MTDEYIPMDMTERQLRLHVIAELAMMKRDYIWKSIENGIVVEFKSNQFTFDVIFDLNLDETHEVIAIIPDPDFIDAFDSCHVTNLDELKAALLKLPY